jgi:hypothetical protein
MEPRLGAEDTEELEQSISAVARALFAAGTVAGVLELTVDLANAAVDGSDAVGVLLVEAERVTTAASSHPIAIELDELQFAVNEGPCLDAIAFGTPSHAEDLAEDPRWPQFGPVAAQVGIRSALAFRLTEQPVSALTVYARHPAAFTATDRAKGLIFATVAGLALDVVGERAEDQQRVANLHEALRTRELIGQAQGILMERERITGEKAFDELRLASQHLNVALREVARTLVETGETPATRTPPDDTTP